MYIGKLAAGTKKSQPNILVFHQGHNIVMMKT